MSKVPERFGQDADLGDTARDKDKGVVTDEMSFDVAAELGAAKESAPRAMNGGDTRLE